MNTKDRNVWHVAAGDTNRNYARILLNWDVVAMGSGRYGSWPECQTAMLADGASTRSLAGYRRFCEEIRDSDIIILKLGTTDVYGVGIAVGNDHYWYDDFGDIDGWDLQLVRRVRWVWMPEEGIMRFPKTYTLKLGTVQSVEEPKILRWLESLEVTEAMVKRPLKQLPSSCVPDVPVARLDIQEISESLFDRGISAQSISTLVDQIGDLIRIANWYERSKIGPTEEETRAYLVVPLLRALGWTPQKMAIEWNNIDVALFSSLPRGDNHLESIVEVKKMNDSCLTATEQAQGYALRRGRSACRRIVVTDGTRYGVHLRQQNGSFTESPQAYLNILRFASEYPVLKCDGARSCLELLSPG